MTDKSYEMIMSHTVQSTNEMYTSDAIDIIAMLAASACERSESANPSRRAIH